MLKNIVLILLVTLLLSGCGNNQNNNEENTNNNTEYNRTSISTNENTEENNIISDRYLEEVKSGTQPKEETKTEPKEEEIASFTTKIYTKDSERQNNIGITCSKLSGSVVKAKDTFSFTSTVGKATTSEGYQEADIFDKDGNKVKGLGGGNCQVSTTLYNAVLAVPTLKVEERHEHSNDVPYVKEGKDAAVAYGSVDFKFTNGNDYDIKIYAEPTKDNITIRLVKLF